MKIYLISIMTFLGAVTPIIACAENVNQIKNLMQSDRSSYTKEKKFTDSNKLFNELENYHSYRPDSYRDLVSHPYTKETNITDSNKLFNELENYDSYRPDSYSDAVRNPFGDKRYRNLKFTTED